MISLADLVGAPREQALLDLNLWRSKSAEAREIYANLRRSLTTDNQPDEPMPGEVLPEGMIFDERAERRFLSLVKNARRTVTILAGLILATNICSTVMAGTLTERINTDADCLYIIRN